MKEILDWLQQQLRQERNYTSEWAYKEHTAGRERVVHTDKARALEEAIRKLGGTPSPSEDQ